MLKTITNHYLDVQVFDADPSKARGPFVIVQEGCAPGDDTCTPKIFVLRHDGAWTDVGYYLAGSGRKHLEEIAFPSMSEVMHLLATIDSTVRVSPHCADREQLASWHAAHPEITADFEGLKRWAAEFRRKALEDS
jgi:hypothetical protein